jgi:hypothetical protein
MGEHSDFFSYFSPFLINIQEMNQPKPFFEDLALFSRAGSSGVTYEGVALCALTRLRVLN